MSTIKIEGLSKSYGKVQVLKDVDIQIGTGLFGLLGPNGAGKTTLMKILSTILPWKDGQVTVYDYDLLKKGTKFGNCLVIYHKIFMHLGNLRGESLYIMSV